jgi:hypothetical protein
MALVIIAVGIGLFFYFESGWLHWLGLVIGILGVLATLGAFVPEESDSAKGERLSAMVEDQMSKSEVGELFAVIFILGRAALENMERRFEPGDPNDPRVTVTDESIRVIYTIAPEGGAYVHHVSLAVVGVGEPSDRGEAAAICAMPAVLVLGDRTEKEVETAVSRRGIYHMEFRLDEAEQREFVARLAAGSKDGPEAPG